MKIAKRNIIKVCKLLTKYMKVKLKIFKEIQEMRKKR
jgi:hypothetical protein